MLRLSQVLEMREQLFLGDHMDLLSQVRPKLIRDHSWDDLGQHLDPIAEDYSLELVEPFVDQLCVVLGK